MKIVIWGHKLHTHTHSYVHEGFFRAFRYLGFDVSWLDNSDDVSEFDFSNTIFLTEGQVDSGVPVREDCKYILHYCDPVKYNPVMNRVLFMERAMVSERRRLADKPDARIAGPWTYYELDYRGTRGWRTFDGPIGAPAAYILWATDLLPDEINLAWAQLNRSHDIYWVGTIGSGQFGNATELGPFALGAIRNNRGFYQRTNLSREAHIATLQLSALAPVIVGQWQLRNGYIPCRLFKNISYGHLPQTNSKHVSSVFDGKLRCNEDTHALFFESEADVHPSDAQRELLLSLMVEVRDNHTYVNRAKTLLEYLGEPTSPLSLQDGTNGIEE